MKIKDIFNRIFAPIICGILGALGGAENSNKAYRRVCIPLLLTGLAWQSTQNIWVFTMMSFSGVLSIGYGIPGVNDNGSFLGRFWYKIFKQNHFWADVFTRGSIGLLIALSIISLPIINHNWIVYFICSGKIVTTNALLSWRNLGQYTLFNKKLNWSETLTWGIISLLIIIIIYVK